MGVTENLQANPHWAGEGGAIFFHRGVNGGGTIVAAAVQAFRHFGRNWASPLTEEGGYRREQGDVLGFRGYFWGLYGNLRVLQEGGLVWFGYLLCERNFPVAWPEPSQPGIGHLREAYFTTTKNMASMALFCTIRLYCTEPFFKYGFCAIKIVNGKTIKKNRNLKGSDSAPSLCLDFGLLARGHPDRDLAMFKVSQPGNLADWIFHL